MFMLEHDAHIRQFITQPRQHLRQQPRSALSLPPISCLPRLLLIQPGCVLTKSTPLSLKRLAASSAMSTLASLLWAYACIQLHFRDFHIRSSKSMSAIPIPTSAAPQEETHTTREPGPLFWRSGCKDTVSRKWPRWFVPNIISNPSSVVAFPQANPALLTKKSKRSNCFWNSSTKALTLARLARSRRRNVPPTSAAADSPGSCRRQARTTLQPCFASCRAVSRPVVWFAPVTIATLPDKSLHRSSFSQRSTGGPMALN
mmetsp:Transcript_113932/g.317250  ORF Transcript_113932/g.317250 Transcript_113932/m.317250 type:complete len:258 (+) Transcript_113932:428-1201(+)